MKVKRWLWRPSRPPGRAEPKHGRQLGWGQSADLDEHLALLRSEFVGLPETCHRHAGLIVRIRREIELEASLAAFLQLWDVEGETLVEHLTSRWLVSACDTYADHGSPFQRAAALMLSATVNTLKLAETERLLLRDVSPDPAKADLVTRSHAAGSHIELWDGMSAYAVTTGDMPRHLFARMYAVLDQDRVLSLIGRTLIDRAIASDTVFGRLAKLNPRFAG
jgi:hypothetical protein